MSFWRTALIMTPIILFLIITSYGYSTAFALESKLWKVKVSSIQDGEESGDIRYFDENQVRINALGTKIHLDLRASETAYRSGFNETGEDGKATYSITITSTTELIIICKGNEVELLSGAAGNGKLEGSFEDGRNTLVTIGTGSVKAVALLLAEGDLNYQDNTALSRGEKASEITGGFEIVGIRIDYTPMQGEGKIAGSAAGGDVQTVVGKIFNAKFRNYGKVDFEADDQVTGEARTNALISIDHRVDITGKCSTQPLTSTLTLQIENGKGTISIYTENEDTGEVVENIAANLDSPVAELNVSSGTKSIDNGWDSPASTWVETYSYALEIKEHIFDIRYDMDSATLRQIHVEPKENAAIILITPIREKDGTLEITLPRQVIDARTDGGDGEFIVRVDGDDSEFEETVTTATERTLRIPIPAGTGEVKIIGTYVIPEFGVLAAFVLAAAVGAIVVMSRKNQIR